jgi:hypothetical protein
LRSLPMLIDDAPALGHRVMMSGIAAMRPVL